MAYRCIRSSENHIDGTVVFASRTHRYIKSTTDRCIATLSTRLDSGLGRTELVVLIQRDVFAPVATAWVSVIHRHSEECRLLGNAGVALEVHSVDGYCTDVMEPHIPAPY